MSLPLARPSLLADLALQFGDLALGPAPGPVAGKRVARPLAELPPPAVQNLGTHLQRPRRLSDRDPLFQPPDGGQLELLRELPTCKAHDSSLHSMDFES